MYEVLNCICFIYYIDLSVEICVGKIVFEVVYNVENDENWLWRMCSKDYKCDDMVYRGYDGYIVLFKFDMDFGVCECSNWVFNKWGEKDKGYNGVGEIIVIFELKYEVSEWGRDC